MTTLGGRLRRLEGQRAAARRCPERHFRLRIMRAEQFGAWEADADGERCPRCGRAVQRVDVVLERVPSRDRRG